VRTDQHFEALFLRCTREFLAERLGFDDYSTACEVMLELYMPLQKQLPPQWHDLLLEGAELSWYIRHEPDTALDFLKDLLEFYKQKTA